MDVVDKDITQKALEQTAKHFDIKPSQVRELAKLYSQYLFAHINEVDLTKDLKNQHTRFTIPTVGVVYFNKLIKIENERFNGRLTEEEVSWSRVWFPRTYKYFEFTLNKYKAIIKTTDND
jgi:hypothetical protein